MPDFQAKLDGEDAEELSQWASVWCDLQLARMSLHERRGLPEEPGTVFTRRALWEQAVVAYARCFGKGRRRKLQFKDVDKLGASYRRVHDEILYWRGKHVGHRVDLDLEAADSVLIFDPEQPELRLVRTYVATPMGPYDAATVSGFEDLAAQLGQRLWETRLSPLALKLAAASGIPTDDRWEKVAGKYLKEQVLFVVDPTAQTFRIFPPPPMWHPDYRESE
jgi:hypothetical protein